MKLFITGIVGAGKTTLARKLGQEMGIPCYELDQIIYQDEGETRGKRTEAEQHVLLSQIDHETDWIIEGCYRKHLPELLTCADHVVFLDPPLWQRRYRILRRFIRQRLGLEEAHYTPDLAMLRLMYRWTDEFEQSGRLELEEILSACSDKIIRIRNGKQLALRLGLPKAAAR